MDLLDDDMGRGLLIFYYTLSGHLADEVEVGAKRRLSLQHTSIRNTCAYKRYQPSKHAHPKRKPAAS